MSGVYCHVSWWPDAILAAPLLDYNGIGIWDMNTGQMIRRIASVDLADIWRLNWIAEDTLVVYRWNGPEENLLLDMSNPSSITTRVITGSATNYSLAWSPEGRQLLTGGDGITIWDIESRQPLNVCTVADKWLELVRSYWIDDNLVVTHDWWSTDTTNYLWDLDTCGVDTTMESFDYMLSTDGTLILDTNQRARPVTDLLGGWPLTHDDPPIASPVYPAPGNMKWSPNNHLIAASVRDEQTYEEFLVVWRTDTGEMLIEQSDSIFTSDIAYPFPEAAGVHEFDWSPDSSLIVIAREGYENKQWGTQLAIVRTETGETVYRHTFNRNSPLYSDGWVAWSPDGKYVALYENVTTADDKGNLNTHVYLSVHNISAGKMELVVELGQTDTWMMAPLFSLSWSPDGQFIITAHGRFTNSPEDRFGSIGGRAGIYFWDPASGALVRTLRGHTNDVFDIAWSPDGSILASTSMDGTVILWSMEE